MKIQSTLSVLTALTASICCIMPVLAMTTGTASLLGSFHWTEPLRPYFVSASFLILGFAWFKALKPKPKDDCGCQTKESFFQSKSFLGIVTVVSALLISFPAYSAFLLKDYTSFADQDQDQTSKVELPVKGMTCTSCEIHIETTLKKLPGVRAVKASYADSNAKIEFDPGKVTRDQLVAAINESGYTVGAATSVLAEHKENCTKETCEVPLADLPKEKSKSLATLKDMNQLRDAFNNQDKSVKFVAILSSTCKWCIQGAKSIEAAIVQKMKDKNIGVIIVWTNMLKSDDQTTALYAASLFEGKSVTQFFDGENKFGDIVARTINPKGEKAWDIYLFFDGETQWTHKLPRPFEYVHQLGPTSEWVDRTKYYCGEKLTQRLGDITSSL